MFSINPDAATRDDIARMAAELSELLAPPSTNEAAPQLEALRTAYEAMNHMGDVLNGMGAVDEEEDGKYFPAFEKVRAAIAKAESVPSPQPMENNSHVGTA